MQIAAHEYKSINCFPEIQSAHVAQPLRAAPKLALPRHKLEAMTHGIFYLRKCTTRCRANYALCWAVNNQRDLGCGQWHLCFQPGLGGFMQIPLIMDITSFNNDLSAC